MSSKSYFETLSDHRSIIREKYEKNENEIQSHIDNIRNWIKDNSQIPLGHFNDQLIEKFLFKTRFCLERTKQKIQNYVNVRSQYRYVFENCDNISPLKESVHVVISKLNQKMERMLWVKIVDEEAFDLNRISILGWMGLEISLRYDYNMGESYVIDMAETSYKLLLKLDPALITMGMNLKAAYSGSIKSIHLINCPTHISVILNIIQKVIPAKIFQRIHVHENLESLRKFVPNSCIPKDYGGELKLFSEMMVDMENGFSILRKNNFFVDILKSIPDIQDNLNGSYKKFEID